jgi:soluble lytic murein transglycosylase-like protein
MQESAMNPKALSHAGAMGLMQLIPATASDLGVQDPWDPLQNIDGGTRYIKQQLETFGDVRWALAAYNAGPNAVRRYSGIPPYEETQDYVRKVMGYYALFSTSRPVGGTSAQP